MKTISNIIYKHREMSLIIVDVLSIILSYILAFFFRVIDLGDAWVRFYDNFINILVLMPIVIGINLLIFYLFKINKSLWKYTSVDEAVRLALASIIANGIWFTVILVINVGPYVKSVPIIATLLQIMIMLGIRIGYRFYRNNWLEKHKHKKALIIGAGSAGDLLLRDLKVNENNDYKVIGFIDDKAHLKGKRVNGVEVLGSVDELDEIVKKINVDCIYIAIPSANKKRISEIVAKCSNLKIRTLIMDYKVKKNLEEMSTLRDVSIEDLLGRDEIVLDSNSISDYLTNKIIMITGAGGSIGSELCRQIIKFKPKKMILFDIYENNMYALQQEIIINKRRGLVDAGIEIVCLLGSVRDKNRLNIVMDKYKPNVLFHAAAHKHVPLVEDSPIEAVKNNVFGTKNTLEACIENGVSKFVLISTDKAVNPTNVMGGTKRICELVVQMYRDNPVTKVGAVRFGNVLGSNGSVIPLFKEQIKAGGPLTVTDPEITRYFMTIPEASRLVLQAGAYANHGDIFVLDMGTPVKILKLAEDMISLCGLKPYEDINIEFIGLRPGEKMYEELSLGNEKRYKTANNLVFVNEPLVFDKEELNNYIEKLYNDLAISEEIVIKDVFEIVHKYN